MLEDKTHYKQIGNTVYIFELGECECCGGAVQECNTVKTFPSEIPKLQYIGLKEYPGELPTEVSWNDNLDMAVCGECDK